MFGLIELDYFRFRRVWYLLYQSVTDYRMYIRHDMRVACVRCLPYRSVRSVILYRSTEMAPSSVAVRDTENINLITEGSTPRYRWGSLDDAGQLAAAFWVRHQSYLFRYAHHSLISDFQKTVLFLINQVQDCSDLKLPEDLGRQKNKKFFLTSRSAVERSSKKSWCNSNKATKT